MGGRGEKGRSCQATKKAMLQKKMTKCQNYNDVDDFGDDDVKEEERMGLPSYEKRQSQNYYNDDEKEKEEMSLSAVRAGNVETMMMMMTLLMMMMVVVLMMMM